MTVATHTSCSGCEYRLRAMQETEREVRHEKKRWVGTPEEHEVEELHRTIQEMVAQEERAAAVSKGQGT